MNISYFLLLVPLAAGIMALIGLFDLRKRKFPSKNLQEIYGILILFPPIIGPILYYFIIVRKKKYKKEKESSRESRQYTK